MYLDACRECLLGCGIAEHGQVNGYALELYRTDRRKLPTRKYARRHGIR